MNSILKLLLLAFIISSCSTSGSNSDSNQETGTETVEESSAANTETEEVNTQMGGDILQFNDGKKWLANPETSEGMLMMQLIIKVFYENSEENRNYAELTGELQYQCNYIIKNCSMKGAPHDELHKVLHPILENVTAAQNAASYEDADTSLNKINDLIAQYLRYFKVEEVPA